MRCEEDEERKPKRRRRLCIAQNVLSVTDSVTGDGVKKAFQIFWERKSENETLCGAPIHIRIIDPCLSHKNLEPIISLIKCHQSDQTEVIGSVQINKDNDNKTIDNIEEDEQKKNNHFGPLFFSYILLLAFYFYSTFIEIKIE